MVSVDAGAQVAIIFTHYIHLDPMWSLYLIETGYVLWVELPEQRRLCPIFVSKVGLPDIHKYSVG